LLVGGAVVDCGSSDSVSDLGGSFAETDDGSADGSLTGGPDSAAQATEAGGCHPGYVVTFQSSPNEYHPATAAWQGVCTQAETDTFYADCLGSTATSSACAGFKSDSRYSVCVACIETPQSASHYGPLVDYGSFIAPNVAGCIELTDPNGLACATKIQTATACELAACQANCPVNGSPDSLAAYDSCTKAADDGVCQSYALAASSCRRAEQDSGLSAPCLNSDFASYYSEVVPVFCGTEPPGTDAQASAADAYVPADSGADGGGVPLPDATMPSEAGDARVSSEAGDATVPDEAGDARAPSEAGDARAPSEAGDATDAIDGGDATAAADAARGHDADQPPSDADDEG
jgi:hypothetical protein